MDDLFRSQIHRGGGMAKACSPTCTLHLMTNLMLVISQMTDSNMLDIDMITNVTQVRTEIRTNLQFQC